MFIFFFSFILDGCLRGGDGVVVGFLMLSNLQQLTHLSYLPIRQVLDRFAALQHRNPNIRLHTMPHVGHWVHR